MKLVTWLLCLTLVLPGCASTSGGVLPVAEPRPDADVTLMAVYARRLPIGARVRADLVDGRRVRGTLLSVSDEVVVIHRHTRLPERPFEVPLASVERLELDTSSSLGKAMAIGVLSGVAGALGVFLILAAIFAD